MVVYLDESENSQGVKIYHTHMSYFLVKQIKPKKLSKKSKEYSEENWKKIDERISDLWQKVNKTLPTVKSCSGLLTNTPDKNEKIIQLYHKYAETHDCDNYTVNVLGEIP